MEFKVFTLALSSLGFSSRDDKCRNDGFPDHPLGHTAEKQRGNDAVAVGAKHHKIRADFFRFRLKDMQRTAIAEMGRWSHFPLACSFGRGGIKGFLRTGAGLFVEGMDCGELIRGETISGVGRFRLDDMKQVELGTKSLGKFCGGGNYASGCI